MCEINNNVLTSDKSMKLKTGEKVINSSQDVTFAVLISLLSMLLYVNSLNHQFVYDDRYLKCYFKIFSISLQNIFPSSDLIWHHQIVGKICKTQYLL